ncbi:uncharacterized protein YALI1_A09190g [Yarrowia lipolytica]|uniref:Uncharacterized protein n=1 Tax=Yarrowia lipolytica TaxID=4952 RepID=A0A1D8N491_YARLL|nr:hypothetical protein YALI1_A09190g [Yarrowia lipolytica]
MTSTSSSSRAQILATGTPPMFASAKNAIISNVRSLKVPSASGYLAKDVEPTQSVTPFTLSSSVSPATTASANPTSAVSVAQTNSVSRTGTITEECSTEVPASEGPKPTSEAPAASPTLSASVDLTTKVTIVEGITKTLTDASTIAPAPYGESKPEPKPELSEGKPAPSGGR